MASADSHRQDTATADLVPLARVPYGPRGASLRPDPSFVMQLIATAAHAPQTRRLRQASASDGVAHYLAARVAVTPRAPEGSRFRQSA